MRYRRSPFGTRWLAVLFALATFMLIIWQLISFSRFRATYPPGLEIGDVPIGKLSRDEARNRLLEVYNLPVELHYEDQIIHLDPTVIEFDLNLESMLAAADIIRVGGPYWDEFWSYLWANQPDISPIPLDASYSETALRNYLANEISPRYDQLATPAQPQIGTTYFQAGIEGTTIDLNTAVIQIERGLFSSTSRSVNLPLARLQPGRPSFQNLEVMLQQALEIAEFDGTAALYLFDLQTYEEIHFAMQTGVNVPTNPDVPFTAASIIKIPILVSAYRYLDEPTPEEAFNLMGEMIEQSGNDPADWLMEQYIDRFQAPLRVTEDLFALGLENTFLAGHFRLGSLPLQIFTTPANSRTDLYLDLDIYTQTTVSEMGQLLSDIYQCAEFGGGALIAVFPGEISQQECQGMIALLERNFTPYLIHAGLPEGTRIAHKHGWVTDPTTGATNVMGDAALIFGPSGDYVLVIYLSHPVQLVWDPISTLMSDLSRIIYNYYALPTR